MTGAPPIARGPVQQPFDIVALRYSARALTGATWVSAAIFALYIAAFFGGALYDRRPATWNASLPGLFDPAAAGANLAIGLHLLAGAILLLLGPIQLLRPVRERFRAFHRWAGRIYAGAAFVAGAGGVAFIAREGTIGGSVMSAGFGLYGVLMMLCSVQAVRFAMAGRLEAHRGWALRLFALTIGSWLYRIDYGFWTLFAGHLGRTPAFSGAFDRTMVFFFYLPNLLVVEFWLRARRIGSGRAARLGAAVTMAAAAALVVLGTYFFAVYEWGPPIVARLAI